VGYHGAHDVVIAGAGAAGLSVAGMLAPRGIEPLVLEREEEVGMSWAGAMTA
jgi:flavin-dependent dehydrogenase